MAFQTKKGTKPFQKKKKGKLGDGKGRPAKGYDPLTKTWIRSIATLERKAEKAYEEGLKAIR